jgi:RNA polymerase sigma-70 factor (ECF subfamily)
LKRNFNQVYEENYNNVYYQAFKHLSGDREAAEDVAQKVFLIYFRKGHQYKGTAKLSTWMYSVCRNECNMYFRKENRITDPMAYLDSREISEINEKEFGVEMPTDPISENLKNALKSLPLPEKVVLRLAIEGHSAKEIGVIVGQTVPAVKSRLHRAKLKVRATLRRPAKRIEIIETPKPKPEPIPVKKKKAKIIEMPHRKGRAKPPRFYTPFYKRAANG